MLSGLLLVLAFPPFESAQLAWVALIPLLLALLHQWNGGLAVAFRLGFVTGLVFWLATMSWMLRLFETSPAPLPLIVVGWGLLAAYCALYLGAFAMTVVWAARKIGVGKLWQNLLLTLLIPVFWAGGEIVRSYFLTGFPWDLLAISQFRSVALIQSAQ
ncbi:MAG: apolipoprotein N-acyltransferase, partial [bacterium]